MKTRFRRLVPANGFSVAAALLLVAVCTAAAQTVDRSVPEVSASLSITAKTGKSEFVRGEEVVVSGTIRNSGETAFIVDDYGEWVRNTVKVYVFDVESGRMLLPRADAPASAVPELAVMPGTEKSFSVNLADVYDLPPNGRFQAAVVATQGAADGGAGQSATSRRVAFSVVEGIELSSAVRSRSGSSGRAMRFSLLYWDQASRQNLFLRVSDVQTGRILAFYRLGAFIRIAEPSLAFADGDTAVVVQQISRDRFARTVVSYAAGSEGVVSRDDNLVSADAFSDAISTRLVNERVDRVLQNRQQESRGGFFRRHKTRTVLPSPSAGSPSPDGARQSQSGSN